MDLQYACTHRHIGDYLKSYKFKIDTCCISINNDEMQCCHIIYVKESPCCYFPDNSTLMPDIKFKNENGKVTKIIENTTGIPFTPISKMCVDTDFDIVVNLLTDLFNYYIQMLEKNVINNILMQKNGSAAFFYCCMHATYVGNRVSLEILNCFDIKQANKKAAVMSQIKTIFKIVELVLFDDAVVKKSEESVKIMPCERKKCIISRKRMRFNFKNVEITKLLHTLHDIFCEKYFLNLQELNINKDCNFDSCFVKLIDLMSVM